MDKTQKTLTDLTNDFDQILTAYENNNNLKLSMHCLILYHNKEDENSSIIAHSGTHTCLAQMSYQDLEETTSKFSQQIKDKKDELLKEYAEYCEKIQNNSSKNATLS